MAMQTYCPGLANAVFHLLPPLHLLCLLATNADDKKDQQVHRQHVLV
jgi:hypothetical protein